MDEKPCCQSCGLPLSPGFYGTNRFHEESHEYCKFCFKDGFYVEPGLSMADMIGRNGKNMSEELQLAGEKAKNFVETEAPKLKRWKTSEL